MLVIIIDSHCLKVNLVKLNSAAADGMQYTEIIKASKNKKLKLKNLLLKIFILNMLFSVLQFIA